VDFEILLKEATVFRPGIAPGRRASPLANQVAISENKVRCQCHSLRRDLAQLGTGLYGPRKSHNPDFDIRKAHRCYLYPFRQSTHGYRNTSCYWNCPSLCLIGRGARAHVWIVGLTCSSSGTIREVSFRSHQVSSEWSGLTTAKSDLFCKPNWTNTWPFSSSSKLNKYE
jgi:hypothetical protein